MTSYRSSQSSALQNTLQESETSQHSLTELDGLILNVQGKVEDSRKKNKEVMEETLRLREEQSELTERRKEMWREDTKLDSLVSRAADELRTAERALAGMMDKVRPFVFMDISI